MRRSNRFSSNKSSQKRYREEEAEQPLDLSKPREKTVDKKKRWNEETNGASDDTNKCSICLDTVNSSIMKSLPCAHVYHEPCINEWLKKSEMCPICRWPITAERNDSPNLDVDWLREAFPIYDDESYRSPGYVMSVRNNSFVLVWNGESEADDLDDDPEADVLDDDPEANDLDDDPESVESRDGSHSEESSDLSESEESRDLSDSEESRDEFESEESHDEFESEESHDEFEF